MNKVHKEVKIPAGYKTTQLWSACGITNGQDKLATFWKDVTCKRCLSRTNSNEV